MPVKPSSKVSQYVIFVVFLFQHFIYYLTMSVLSLHDKKITTLLVKSEMWFSFLCFFFHPHANCFPFLFKTETDLEVSVFPPFSWTCLWFHSFLCSLIDNQLATNNPPRFVHWCYSCALMISDHFCSWSFQKTQEPCHFCQRLFWCILNFILLFSQILTSVFPPVTSSKHLQHLSKNACESTSLSRIWCI